MTGAFVISSVAEELPLSEISQNYKGNILTIANPFLPNQTGRLLDSLSVAQGDKLAVVRRGNLLDGHLGRHQPKSSVSTLES